MTEELGPKMMACSEREQAFVMAYLSNGGNGTEAARAAGYSDPAKGDYKGSAGIRVRAYELLHREKVLAAIEEVGRKEFRGLLVPALTALKTLLEKPDHTDHAKVVQSVLSRLGFSEKAAVEMNINHTHTDRTGAALMDRIKELAAKHGLDPEKLLGGNVPREASPPLLGGGSITGPDPVIELKAETSDG